MTDYTAYASLECYYKFENAGDLGEDERNQIDLTNNNGVTQSSDIPSGTYAAPTAQNSASFVKASSQYLSASHADSTEVDDITALTVVMWVKLASAPSTTFLYSKRSGAGTGHYAYLNAPTNATFNFDSAYYAQTVSTVSNDKWYFYAFVYHPDDDKLYIYRGDEEAQVTLQGSGYNGVDLTASTTGDFTLGVEADTPSLFLDGLMCEPAFFTEALSLADLQAIQQYGIAGAVSAGVIAQLAGVAWASVGQIAGVAEASIAEIAGVAAN